MANTYIAIATVTVGSGGAADIQFTSIPGTYTDLKIVISGRTNRGGAFEDSMKIQLGSTGSVDTGNNYTSRILQQYNNTVSSAAETNVGYITCYSVFTAVSATTSTFGNAEIYIPNYTSSNAKSVSIDGVSETNGTQGSNDMAAGLWTGTGIINIIKVFPYFGSFVQYTTATLYGIKNS